MGFLDDVKKMLGLGGAKPKAAAAKPASAPPIEIPVVHTGERAEFDEVIKLTVAQYAKTHQYFYGIKVSDNETYLQTVKPWEDKKRVRFVVYCCVETHEQTQKDGVTVYNSPNEFRKYARLAYVQQLLRTKLVMDDEDMALILKSFSESKAYGWSSLQYWPVAFLLNQIAAQRKGQAISGILQNALRRIHKQLQDANDYYEKKERAKLIEKLDTLLFVPGESASAVKPTKFLGVDDFSQYANAVIAQLPAADQPVWYQMISQAQRASGSKPTAKYLADSKTLLKEISSEKFKRVVVDWFTFVIQLKEKETRHTQTFAGREYTHSTYVFLDAANTEPIKGFVWMCAHFHDTLTLQTIAKLAERCYKKIPSIGPASAAIGNACLFVLFKSKGLEGIGHLSRLKLRIKQASTQAMIDKYLAEAAKAQGITVTEIEDLAVDDYGLQDGKRRWVYDDYAFELEVIGAGKIQQQWYKPDGSPQKSEPTAVKTNHAAKLKKMKLVIKQIEQASTAQRDRMDRMLRSDRKMQGSYFQQFYLQHGLMSFLAKKLLWNFHQDGATTTAIWSAAGWLNAEGKPVTITDNAEVTLWHPALSSLADIKAWRAFLMEMEILQPMKQAFREVYLLTDAEVNTRIYSNRMAAHMLKQHQFNSLAKGRGWKYALLGAYDDGREGELASLHLPEFGLRAEYWVTGVNSDGEWNDTGIWNYIATDQVRFVNTSTGQPVELIDVPAIAFSEAMRDVDLFVGVASVGNDPTWRDSGGIPAYRDYWQSYSFGDLTEVAKMRKEILTGLIQRLKIKNVASIVGNYLVVQGKLRTYKIHIGSTNILMEPNDQYLCIVPDRSIKTGTENVFLPFEGDNGLSIVLSKAFLLAEDDKITDRTITSQILRQ